MATTAAAVAALDQQAVIDAFMQAKAAQPAKAIFYEPENSTQRRFFQKLIENGSIKAEGMRWYIDLPVYGAEKSKRRKKTLVITVILAAAAGLAALI